MSSWPQKEDHAWSDLVVGGAAGEPLIFKLYETLLIPNGSFEDVLSGWNGSPVREDFGSNAMRGNYVLACENIPYAHTYFDRTSPDNSLEMNKILFTGFVKAEKVTGGIVNIKVYTSTGTTRVASPTKYNNLKIYVDKTCMVIGSDGYTQWVKFYLMADITAMTGGYVHFEISSAQYATVDYYLDDLRVYEVKGVLELECPQTLNLIWKRHTDANYDMEDGTNKDYVRGWRPVFSLGYEYCSAAELIKHIGVSENEFNFFAPHKDSINGEYVRITDDFESSYFNNRFLGHSQNISLVGIHIRKNKNTEFDSDYFDIVVA